MLASEAKKVVLGLLLLLAVVGNIGVVEAVTASQEISIPWWASLLGGVLVLIPEVLLLAAFHAQTGWNPGCLGQNLAILYLLTLPVWVTVRFAYAGKVILSWFGLDVSLWWLVAPGLLAAVLYFASSDVLHDEGADEALGDHGGGGGSFGRGGWLASVVRVLQPRGPAARSPRGLKISRIRRRSAPLDSAALRCVSTALGNATHPGTSLRPPHWKRRAR